jgi:uncharacterized membrane protein YqgA involved in biofilm formation
LGTLINVLAILAGSAIGVLLGNRLPEKMSRTLTDAMGLVVLVIGALNLLELTNESFANATGVFPTILVVLASLLLGGVTGSLMNIEGRLEQFGTWLQAKTKGKSDKELFIQGFVNSALLFTIGPMAILGALQDGLGQGFDVLALKSTLDGFTSVAFSATMGWGVAFSAIPVGLWQGVLTILSATLGAVLSDAAVAAITATGGILLLGTGLRLLQIRMVSVADLLPALIFAPVITLVLATTLGQ